MKHSRFATVFVCVALLAAQTVSAGTLPLFNPTASTTLTKDNLGDFLRSVGYDPSAHGDGVYWISVPLFGKSQTVVVGISSDTSRLWLYARVASLPSLAGVSADTLSGLLLANDQYGPAHFSIQRCEKCNANERYVVWYNNAIENRTVTPATFRAGADLLVKNLTQTVDLWDQKNWRR